MRDIRKAGETSFCQILYRSGKEKTPAFMFTHKRLLRFLAFLSLALAGCATLFAATAPEVEWEKTFGGPLYDVARSVRQTTDGGYILAGTTWSYGAGYADFWLVKVDPDGNLEWSKTFGGARDEEAYSVQQTSDGGYILAGFTDSYGAGYADFWLVKVDPDGNLEWSKTFGGTDFDVAYSVQQTTDGGYILAGFTESYGAGYADFWLVKVDPNGNLEWSKTFGGPLYEVARSVQQTTDGGYILAGTGTSYGPSYADFWLVKVDPDGNLEWSKTFGGAKDEEAYSVQQTTDGGYILAGFTESYGAGHYDFWLVKVDSNGNLEWSKTFGGAGYDVANSVQQTSDGGYILAGYTCSYGGAGGYDFWLVKVDPDGTLEWSKTFGGDPYQIACSVQQTTDGGYILAGSGYTCAYDACIVKLKPEQVIDATPPSLVTDFNASDGEDGQSTLTWTNPSDADLAEVVVRRKVDGYPANHTDGELVYQDTSPTPGQAVSHTDAGLVNGTTYYHAVFSRDTAGNWNDRVVESKNADTATPGLESHAPIARASNISGQPETMYPDTAYTVTAKYFDPDGREDLKYCYLRLDHPEKPLTMMWYQEDGHAAPWAGEEGENYLTRVEATATEIVDPETGYEGYEIAWTFEINDSWPEAENAIDFGVCAVDDHDSSSGWDYDDTNASFIVKGTIRGTVKDELAGEGIAGATLLLEPDPLTYCPITDSLGNFSFNVPAGTYNVTATADGYRSHTKTGVVVNPGKITEINFLLAPSFSPYPYGYKFRNATVTHDLDILPWVEVVEGLTEEDKRLIFEETFDWEHVYDPLVKDLLFDAYKDTIGTGGNCYGMAASALMEYVHPEYDSVLENQGQRYIWDLDMSWILDKWNGRNMRSKPTLQQILKFQLAQYGLIPRSQTRNFADNPRGLLEELKKAQMPDFLLGIGFYNKNKGRWNAHALVPYRIVEDKVIALIFVYDPNWPDTDGDAQRGDEDKAFDRYVEIDKSSNTWRYIFQWDRKGNPIFWPPEYAKKSEQVLALIPLEAHHYFDNAGMPRPGGKLTEVPSMTICMANGPVEFSVEDEQGRVTGVVDGEFLWQIPEVKPLIGYVSGEVADLKWSVRYLIVRPRPLTLKVKGKREGPFGVMYLGEDLCVVVNGGRITPRTTAEAIVEPNDIELRFSAGTNTNYDILVHRLRDGGPTFRGEEIPVGSNSVHKYTIDWNALSMGKEGVLLQIDQDGDGIFERTIRAGSELKGEDFGVVPNDSIVNHGPNPVPPEGCIFWLNLPDDAAEATLKIFDVDGALLVSIPLDPTADRYPETGRWIPQDAQGRLLGTGLYLYLVEIVHADGTVTRSPVQKMVIQR